MDVEIISERDVRIPILLMQMREIKAPLLEELAHTERADDILHLWFQCHHCRIVEVVPMVVRHEEDIQFRNILCDIDIAPTKRTIDEEDRRAVVGEYRIDKHAPPADLQVERRMSHPDRNILRAGDRVKVRLITGDCLFRHASIITAEEHTTECLDAVRLLLVGQIVHHHLDRLEAEELSAHVVRRCLNPFQTLSRGRPPKLLLPHKESCTARKCPHPRQRTKDKISAFHKALSKSLRHIKIRLLPAVFYGSKLKAQAPRSKS